MKDVLSLCYHAVSPSWDWRYAVRPEQLEAHVRELLRRGYRPATFTEAVTAPAARRTLAVTFDDGHRSVLELGLPVLSKLGVPATVFVVTGHVDSGRPLTFGRLGEYAGTRDEHELASLTWHDLGRLADEGWEIGSHTQTHSRLTDLDNAALGRELSESREACAARLGLPCSSIAYPFGAADARVAVAAGAAGYRAGAAVEAGFRPREALRHPRVPILLGDDSERFARKTSPVRRRMAVFRLGRGLSGARRLAVRA
jgi:peptidoglycan/xylan/chitin deacetylase (PgdA/CDA1 family)